MDRDWVVERLRRGSSVALALSGERSADRPGRAEIEAIARELRELGRETLWIDFADATSGADLAGRIIEACWPVLDPEQLGDVLERVPGHGRIDLEAFVELLMLPEQIAAQRGRRIVAILDRFEFVERAIGLSGLVALRDVLLLRDRVAYLFVGGPRLETLFSHPNRPLFGLAEVAALPDATQTPARTRMVPAAAVEPSPTSDDPLAAMLLRWAEPPPPPRVQPVSPANLAWERLVERERSARDWLDQDDDDRWRRARRRRRR